jgi:hypothetical protein
VADPLGAGSAVASPGRRVLTVDEVAVLWQHLRLGPAPVVLQLGPTRPMRAKRRELGIAGWQGLRARGLAGPTGPEPELVRLLHVLAAPQTQLELRGWWGRGVRALAAGRPGMAAVAVRHGATIALAACGSLPAGLLDAMPPAPPGPGRPVCVPAEVLAAALAARGWPAAELAARGVAPGDAEVLARMLTAADRRAQVVGLVADRWGGLRRTRTGVGILDGRDGRYVETRRAGGDRVERATVAPADEAHLRHRLAELLVRPTAETGDP